MSTKFHTKRHSKPYQQHHDASLGSSSARSSSCIRAPPLVSSLRQLAPYLPSGFGSPTDSCSSCWLLCPNICVFFLIYVMMRDTLDICAPGMVILDPEPFNELFGFFLNPGVEATRQGYIFKVFLLMFSSLSYTDCKNINNIMSI